MADDRYTGAVGAPEAMSALAPEFQEAYSKAVRQMLEAVTEFERVTGRTVDSVALERVNVTTVGSPAPQYVRQVTLHFLPRPDEVAW